MTRPVSTTRLTRARTHLLRLTTAALALAMMLIVSPLKVAQAHHGFDDFDTDRLYYISGTVSEVRWGEPHSYFVVTLDGELPSDTPELVLPEQLQASEDAGPINAAPSYGGSHEALQVVIAPPSFTGRWGLERALVDGERVEAVGYVGRSHDDEYRPVVFWFDGGRPVNQVLGSQLPARPLPVPYPQADAPVAVPDQDAPEAAAETSPMVVWVALGLGVLVITAAAAVYLRARSSRDT